MSEMGGREEVEGLTDGVAGFNLDATTGRLAAER
jgi:hypothetical protein